MGIQTTSNRMQSIVTLYDMHTTFFSSVLEGISDADAHNRLNTKANHIAWLTGSLVHERYEMARSSGTAAAGSMEQHAAPELFRHHKGIQDDATYPPLARFRQDWANITPVLREVLVTISDEKLDSPFEMPGEPMTYFDLIAFMMYREANCIGQIALWRRLLGYEAIKYM